MLGYALIWTFVEVTTNAVEKVLKNHCHNAINTCLVVLCYVTEEL